MAEEIAPSPVHLSPEMQELRYQAAMAVRSKLLPGELDTPEKALVAMQMGRELGLSPMYAARQIYVVKGKPTCSSELMANLIYRRHGDNALRMTEWTAERVTVRYKRKGWDSFEEFTYTMDDAKRAGLTNNPSWSKFPHAMLRARAISTVARAAFPDCIGGMYTPDELGGDIEVDPDTNEIHPAWEQTLIPVQ